MGWMINATPRPLYSRERDPIPIVREAGWTPGAVWTGAENLACTGIRSPDRQARSKSLYRLRYLIWKLQTNESASEVCVHMSFICFICVHASCNNTFGSVMESVLWVAFVLRANASHLLLMPIRPVFQNTVRLPNTSTISCNSVYDAKLHCKATSQHACAHNLNHAVLRD
jgi:hypothetical protein